MNTPQQLWRHLWLSVSLKIDKLPNTDPSKLSTDICKINLLWTLTITLLTFGFWKSGGSRQANILIHWLWTSSSTDFVLLLSAPWTFHLVLLMSVLRFKPYLSAPCTLCCCCQCLNLAPCAADVSVKHWQQQHKVYCVHSTQEWGPGSAPLGWSWAPQMLLL